MRNETRELRAFFGLTLALSWGLPGLLLLSGVSLDRGGPLFAIAACGPSAAALVLSARHGQITALLRRIWRRTTWRAAAASVIILPGLAGTAALLSGAPLMPSAHAWSTIRVADPAPLGEELGWRGYALPRLLEITTPLGAALILGCAWVIWHIPAFFIANAMLAGRSGFAWWAVGTIALSGLMTWIYLIGRENILVAGILPHAIVNMMGSVGLWSSNRLQALLLLGVAVVALGLQLSYGQPTRQHTAVDTGAD